MLVVFEKKVMLEFASINQRLVTQIPFTSIEKTSKQLTNQ